MTAGSRKGSSVQGHVLKNSSESTTVMSSYLKNIFEVVLLCNVLLLFRKYVGLHNSQGY